MSNFPSVLPTLNLQFANQKTPEDMLSLLNSVGATFDRGSESVAKATYFDSLGVLQTAPANYSRPYFDPETGQSLGILIEEGRTNLVLNQNITSAYWTKSLLTAATYSGTRFGSNCYKLTVTSNGTTRIFAPTTSEAFFTVYVKALSVINKDIKLVQALGNSATFTLGDTTVTTSTGASEFWEYLGDGWFRIGYKTSASGNGNQQIEFENETVSDEWLIALPQTEVGEFPTSAILTSGSSVSRSADDLSITGSAFSDFYNQDEGSFLCEVNNIDTGQIDTILRVNDGTSNNMLELNFLADNKVVLIARSGGAEVSRITSTSTYSGKNKVSFNYSPGGIELFINGTKIGENTTALTFAASLTSLYIGINQAGASLLNGNMLKSIYFPKPLIDTEHQRLTYNG